MKLRKPNSIEQIFDHDIYYVEEDIHGNKQLNVQRYYYDGDESIMCQEYIGIRLPIPTTREEVEDAIENCSQMVGEVMASEVWEDIKRMKRLPIDKVDEFTSLGKYVDME